MPTSLHKAPKRSLIGSSAARAMFAPVVIAAALYSLRAQAYRPFDGTDAEVAALGSFELEMGPAHWYTQAGKITSSRRLRCSTWGFFRTLNWW